MVAYVDPVVLPPDVEQLAIQYLSGPLSPTPVATRLPSPSDAADTVNGLLRVEAGGGQRANKFQHDVQVILHGYNPDEVAASLLARQAMALVGAARGQTVGGWYIVGVMDAVEPHRLTDPDVILPRYRCAVTWRVAGQQWSP